MNGPAFGRPGRGPPGRVREPLVQRKKRDPPRRGLCRGLAAAAWRTPRDGRYSRSPGICPTETDRRRLGVPVGHPQWGIPMGHCVGARDDRHDPEVANAAISINMSRLSWLAVSVCSRVLMARYADANRFAAPDRAADERYLLTSGDRPRKCSRQVSGSHG
jgi:hypothetical protein